jgi:hypothetical protein
MPRTVTAALPSPWPRRGLDWLVRDDRLLHDGLAAGLDVFELAAELEREPVEVATRSAHLCTGDDLAFSAGSEELLALLDLALSGVPLAPALSWCRGNTDRPAAGELEDLRKVPSCLPALEFAAELGIWDIRHDTIDALEQLMAHPAQALRAAVAALHAGFEAVTTVTLSSALAGRAPASATLTPTIVPVRSSYSGRSSSTRRGRPSRTARRRGRPSPSYPTPAPAVADRRTPAERAWESRTHW